MAPVFTIITRTNSEAGEESLKRDAEAFEEVPGKRDDDPILTSREVTIYSIIGFGSILLLFLIVVLWLRAKTRSTEIMLFDAERKFEREMFDEFKQESQALPAESTPSRPSPLIDNQPISPGVTSAGLMPAAAHASNSSARDAFDVLAEKVCSRLEAAGQLQSREGPLMLSDSDTRGLMIKLRGDKLALVIGDWESEKFYRRQLNRFEVIFVARDADNITVLQNMPRYMGDRASL